MHRVAIDLIAQGGMIATWWGSPLQNLPLLLCERKVLQNDPPEVSDCRTEMTRRCRSLPLPITPHANAHTGLTIRIVRGKQSSSCGTWRLRASPRTSPRSSASQTHAWCINDLAASGVIESSPAHLEGGEIGPSILETARLKERF